LKALNNAHTILVVDAEYLYTYGTSGIQHYRSDTLPVTVTVTVTVSLTFLVVLTVLMAFAIRDPVPLLVPVPIPVSVLTAIVSIPVTATKKSLANPLAVLVAAMMHETNDLAMQPCKHLI
jgi:hypothetical protein